MFPHCNDPGKGVGNRGIEIYIVNYLEPIRALGIPVKMNIHSGNK